jgi:hypothetical protein
LTKRALLIGIDEYSSPNIPNLQGCVNDITAIGGVLTDLYGFQESNLKSLTSPAETTRQNIFDELEALIERTEDGDVTLVYYSGHGSQAPDTSNDEEGDKLDETIVPSDTGRGDLPVVDIVDDELHSYIAALALRTPYVYFVFDSCHSGSVTRELAMAVEMMRAEAEPEFVPRAIPPAKSPVEGERRFYPSVDHYRGEGRSETGFIPKGDYLMIGGCLDHQTSKESQVGGVRRGMLSWYLETELRKDPNASIDAVFERASKGVIAHVEEQDPVLEGPLRLCSTPFAAGTRNRQSSNGTEDSNETQGPKPAKKPTNAKPAAPKPPNQSGEGDKTNDTPDDEGEGEGNSTPGEWDSEFAQQGGWLVLAMVLLFGLGIGGLCVGAGNDISPLQVTLVVTVGLLAVGLLLAMTGGYIGLLEARGRARALRALPATTEGAGTRGVGLPDLKDLKGLFEEMRKMPTARGLITVAAIVFVAATAFAWHMIPESSEGDAPSLVSQPKAQTVAAKGTAYFSVSASGTNLSYEWLRNGKTIADAPDEPVHTVAAVTRKQNGTQYAVVVRNEHGEATSDSAKLTVPKLKGKKNPRGSPSGSSGQR